MIYRTLHGLTHYLTLFFPLFMWSGICLALEVSPLVLNITTTGKTNSSSLMIGNNTDQSIPIDMSIQHVQFRSDGSYDLAPHDNELLLFPPAMILRPGAKQIVRVQWAGSKILENSKSYFIKISQVPVALPKQSTNGIQLNLTFNVLLHTASLENKSEMKVKSAELVRSSSGIKVKANIQNTGAKYSYLSNNILTIMAKGKSHFVIPSEKLRESTMDVFFPPQSERTVYIPLDAEGITWNDPITLEISPKNRKK